MVATTACESFAPRKKENDAREKWRWPPSIEYFHAMQKKPSVVTLEGHLALPNITMSTMWRLHTSNGRYIQIEKVSVLTTTWGVWKNFDSRRGDLHHHDHFVQFWQNCHIWVRVAPSLFCRTQVLWKENKESFWISLILEYKNVHFHHLIWHAPYLH